MKRPRSKTFSDHKSVSTTVAREATLFPEFDRIQQTANVFINATPMDLSQNDKLKNKLSNAYMDVLDAIETIADNPDITEDEIIDFTNKTIQFLKLVHQLPPDVVTSVQDKAQLSAIKNYAKECADIFVSKGLNRRASIGQYAPGAQTLKAASEGLENSRQRLTEKFDKHQRKTRKFDFMALAALHGIMLIVTIPIAVPLFFYFDSKSEKSMRKGDETNTELRQLDDLRNTFSDVQAQLRHIDHSDAKLSLSSEEKAEKMRTLKDSVQGVKQALGADLQHSSEHRRTRRP